ncbi:hypothetical protein HK405_015759, partial [Cladochytrium tenue]
PLRDVAPRYAGKQVLAIGPPGVRELAVSCGFDRPLVSEDVLAWRPQVWQYRLPDPAHITPAFVDLDNDPVEAVLCFGGSVDWGQDIQVVCDVLLSSGGVLGRTTSTGGSSSNSSNVDATRRPHAPVYFSNDDMLFSNSFPTPRLGDGAFLAALRAVYARRASEADTAASSSVDLDVTIFGKPRGVAFAFARAALARAAAAQGLPAPARVYMVGDNPRSDAAGAVAAGLTAVLVRTGLYSDGADGGSGDTGGAAAVVDTVADAVEWILKDAGVAVAGVDDG